MNIQQRNYVIKLMRLIQNSHKEARMDYNGKTDVVTHLLCVKRFCYIIAIYFEYFWRNGLYVVSG